MIACVPVGESEVCGTRHRGWPVAKAEIMDHSVCGGGALQSSRVERGSGSLTHLPRISGPQRCTYVQAPRSKLSAGSLGHFLTCAVRLKQQTETYKSGPFVVYTSAQ